MLIIQITKERRLNSALSLFVYLFVGTNIGVINQQINVSWKNQLFLLLMKRNLSGTFDPLDLEVCTLTVNMSETQTELHSHFPLIQRDSWVGLSLAAELDILAVQVPVSIKPVH